MQSSVPSVGSCKKYSKNCCQFIAFSKSLVKDEVHIFIHLNWQYSRRTKKIHTQIHTYGWLRVNTTQIVLHTFATVWPCSASLSFKGLENQFCVCQGFDSTVLCTIRHFLTALVLTLSHLSCCLSSFFISSLPVAMYREPSLHDVGETVPKAAVLPSKSTSEPAVMNGGKPVSKPDKPTT